MKNFLRILFLGAVLLVVLGLFKSQSSDREEPVSESPGLEQCSLQSAILPAEPFKVAPSLIPSPIQPGGDPEQKWLGREVQLTRLAGIRIQNARRIMEDISPGLLHRMGHLIHSFPRTKIPS